MQANLLKVLGCKRSAVYNMQCYTDSAGQFLQVIRSKIFRSCSSNLLNSVLGLIDIVADSAYRDVFICSFGTSLPSCCSRTVYVMNCSQRDPAAASCGGDGRGRHRPRHAAAWQCSWRSTGWCQGRRHDRRPSGPHLLRTADQGVLTSHHSTFR